jgi:hypothetical protein
MNWEALLSNESVLPRVLCQRTARRLLEAHAWIQDPGATHVVKMMNDRKGPITLPLYRGNDYAAALSAAILRQAGLRGDSADD